MNPFATMTIKRLARLDLVMKGAAYHLKLDENIELPIFKNEFSEDHSFERNNFLFDQISFYYRKIFSILEKRNLYNQQNIKDILKINSLNELKQVFTVHEKQLQQLYQLESFRDITRFSVFCSINNGHSENGTAKNSPSLPNLIIDKIGSFFIDNQEKRLEIMKQAQERASQLQEKPQQNCNIF